MTGTSRAEDQRRRATDRPSSPSFLASLEKSVTGDLSAVSAGRLLLATSGFVVTIATPLLQPTRAGWDALILVSIAMAAVLALTFALPWSRLPDLATLAFPVAVCLGLVLIGLTQVGLVAPLTGVLTLCFAYLGLTQPPRTSIFATPVAGATFVVANGTWSPAIAVRLAIAIFIWVLLGELLARLTRRQQALTVALRSAAHTDPLTGVANRRDLDIRLATASSGDALVICDLDHFKKVNDTLGHHAGDRILADFGAMLRLTLRHHDYCARFGGEEFVLLLSSAAPDHALPLLARLRENWSTLHPSVTFSSGRAGFLDDRSQADTLAAADRALYVAKAEGRDTDRAEPGARVPEPAH